MITAALVAAIAGARRGREPFVTATVVRAQRPTSVEPGSVALVLGDGTIEGFVGGDVRRAQRPRLLAGRARERRAGAAADPARSGRRAARRRASEVRARRAR